jgi:hypothetical protein
MCVRVARDGKSTPIVIAITDMFIFYLEVSVFNPEIVFITSWNGKLTVYQINCVIIQRYQQSNSGIICVAGTFVFDMQLISRRKLFVLKCYEYGSGCK